MTLVSNDPVWWPSIDSYRIASYFIVAATAGVMYDWGERDNVERTTDILIAFAVLTFGHEVELIWRQRWSLMTGLYLSARYLGIIYAAIGLLIYVPTISVTDAGCHNVYVISNSMITVVNAILGVIMIARLYAMYQRRDMLVLLSVIFLAVTIANGVTIAIITTHMTEEELILSGTYQCFVAFLDNTNLPYTMYWMFTTAWEVLALCLAIWIAVMHFRELQRPSTGWIIRDCFTVLTKSHLVYFTSFVAVSCFNFGYLSPTITADPFSLESQIYPGLTQIFLLVQLFVLGPRLILSVREYHAKHVADSDGGASVTSLAFREHVHVSTSSSV